MKTFTLFKRAAVFCLMAGLLCLMSLQEAKASHTMGGELTYEYVGTSGNPLRPFRYKIKFSAYVDANSSSPSGCLEFGGGPCSIDLKVYSAGGSRTEYTNLSFNLPISLISVQPDLPPGCTPSSPLNLFQNYGELL